MAYRKSYIGIKNEVASSTLELDFTDFIYDGFDWNTWEDENMVQNTIDKIRAAKPSTIKIVINSLGGDVMIGLALYNYIKAYDAEVEVEIIGFAASIASVMAMAASPGKLRMAKSSFLIIHAAWQWAVGNATDIRKIANDLDKVSLQLAGIYADRTSGETKKDATYFTDLWAAGDYWMTATEANQLGLVDEIFNAPAVAARMYQGKKINAKVNPRAYGFKNVPDSLKNDIGTPLSDSDKEFLNQIIQIDESRITLSKDILQTTGNSFVQQLAGCIISCDTEDLEEMEEEITGTPDPGEGMENNSGISQSTNKKSFMAKLLAKLKAVVEKGKKEVEKTPDASKSATLDFLSGLIAEAETEEAAETKVEDPKKEVKPEPAAAEEVVEEEAAGEGAEASKKDKKPAAGKEKTEVESSDLSAVIKQMQEDNKELRDLLAASLGKPQADKSTSTKVSKAKIEYEN